MALDARLEELASRIERLALEPEAIEASWLDRLTAPVMRWVGWRPKYVTDRLMALVDEVRSQREGWRDRAPQRLAAAAEELADNVDATEDVCRLYGRAPVAHLAWLGRMVRVTARMEASLAIDAVAGARQLAALDPVLVAPPLAVAEAALPKDAAIAGEAHAEPSHARLVELQLAAIDHIVEAAQQETAFLERRRRLLEAARRLLLDADAALDLDATGMRSRQRHLAEQIVQVDRLQGLGLDPRVDLLHQARSALQRGERERLHAALVALEGFAAAAADERLGRGASAAITTLAPEIASGRESLRRSVDETFGDDVSAAIRAGHMRGQEAQRTALEEASSAKDREVAELALEYLAPGKDEDSLAAILSVDGCFDVGAPLSPVRVEERRTVARLVRHPTADLVLTPARSAEDIPHAILGDPRALLVDLASGRLLTRRYVHYEERSHERIEMVGEVRIYLLDGSTSMLTDGIDMARGRMRDAILTAELATLLKRFSTPDRYTRVVLFYRYFTKQLWPLHRVADTDAAMAAMGDVAATPRRGGTHIEQALLSSFDLIRDARGKDPALAQAQVVLITDGQADVSFARIAEAREKTGDLPIAVSVIALGEENPALRTLVARQRAAGERAFYHHIDDRMLAATCRGDLAATTTLHLLDPGRPEHLADQLGTMLDDLAELERTRHAAVMSFDETSYLEETYRELGIDAPTDGECARRAAAARDRASVRERFDAWFPHPDQVDDEAAHEDDVDSMVVVLSTVVEVLAELGDDATARQADAVDVVERLLPDARLAPSTYDALLRHGGPRVAEALGAVHDVVFAEPFSR